MISWPLVHCFSFSWTLPSRFSKPLTQIKKWSKWSDKKFPHIFGLFPGFSKSYKFSFCWLVSPVFFKPFPRKFGPCPVFRKSKKFQFVGLLFLQIFGPFLVFRKSWKIRTKNEGTPPSYISTIPLITFLKTGNGIKICGNGSKKKEKPTNKLKIYNFFWKPETNQKFTETDRKKQETDQQTENF